MTDSYGNDGSFGGSRWMETFKGEESLGKGVQRTNLDNPASTNGEGMKPLWRRKMKGCGSTYADFLDGRGIVMWNPSHARSDEDGWLINHSDKPHIGDYWPIYNNEQDQGRDLIVSYYGAFDMNNIRLSPTQTAKWNEYYGYTPPLSEEEQREQELAALTPRERKIEELSDLIHKEVKRLTLLKNEEKRLAKAHAFQQQQVAASVETIQRIHAALEEVKADEHQDW